MYQHSLCVWQVHASHRGRVWFLLRVFCELRPWRVNQDCVSNGGLVQKAGGNGYGSPESREMILGPGTSGTRWLRGTWLDLRSQNWPRTRTRPCGSKRASSGRSGSGLPPRFPAGCPGCGWRPGCALGGQCSKGGLGHVVAGEVGRVLARQADPNSAERSDWPKAAPASFSAGEEGSGFWRRPTSLAHRAAVGQRSSDFSLSREMSWRWQPRAALPVSQGTRAAVPGCQRGFFFQVFILACTDCCCFYCRCV